MGWCDECDKSLENFICEKKVDECEHMFVWKRNGVSGQIFRCHECGDTKVVK